MHSLGRLKQWFAVVARQMAHRVAPGASRVEYLLSHNREFPAAPAIDCPHAAKNAPGQVEGNRFNVVDHEGAMQGCRAQHFQTQARIVHVGVEILGPSEQSLWSQARKLTMQARQRHGSAAVDVASAGEEVIKDETNPEFPRTYASTFIEGQHETQRIDKV